MDDELLETAEGEGESDMSANHEMSTPHSEAEEEECVLWKMCENSDVREREWQEELGRKAKLCEQKEEQLQTEVERNESLLADVNKAQRQAQETYKKIAELRKENAVNDDRNATTLDESANAARLKHEIIKFKNGLVELQREAVLVQNYQAEERKESVDSSAEVKEPMQLLHD